MFRRPRQPCRRGSPRARRRLIEAWSRFRIQAMTLPILNAALRIRKTVGFHFGQRHCRRALALGCDRVYTEDLAHGQVVEGLAIIDPFK